MLKLVIKRIIYRATSEVIMCDLTKKGKSYPDQHIIISTNTHFISRIRLLGKNEFKWFIISVVKTIGKNT